MDLPLNALRAFEVSARHLNFTRAAEALNLTQTAVSQHVKNLEASLGVALFRRVPRGLVLTDEGQALLPVLSVAFTDIAAALATFGQPGRRAPQELLAVGAVGSFAVGWLLPRLRQFQQSHPFVDLRLFTHNNRVDLAAEGLDCAIRFGDGPFNASEATPLLRTPLSPVCTPGVASRLQCPQDLAREPLLRSYRSNEWAAWFGTAGCTMPPLRGPVFDSSLALAEAAAQGVGVALLPTALFTRDLRAGRLVRPFDTEVELGRYWLLRQQSRRSTPGFRAFRDWLVAACAA